MTDERAPLEVRSATIEQGAVNHKQRMIELLAVPYDTWATVQVDRRMVEESFAPGAFGRADMRAQRQRMMVNVEHDRANWVGRVDKLHVNERAGLRAEVKIQRSARGDQILDDAEDGMYGASVGFRATDAGIEWDRSRTRRRILTAYLEHIALTVDPAFDGAEVLAVRSASEVTSATPNLDRILAERARLAYRTD